MYKTDWGFMEIAYNNKNKTLKFKYYKVVQKPDNYFGIYDNENNLISHKDKWQKATKLASLLDGAYEKAYKEGISW